MRKLLLLTLMLLSSLVAMGQGGGYTQVTGTLVPYANGSVTAAYINQSTAPTLPLLNGSVFPTYGATTFDSSGKFTIYLADDNIIFPTPSQWKITVCQKGGSQPPCYTVTLTITGATQDISSQIAAAPLPQGNFSPFNFVSRNLTTALASTTLFTAPATALYQLNAAVNCDSASGTSATLTISYTDPSSTVQTITLSAANCTTLGAESIASLNGQAFNAKFGTTIIISTAISGTPTYDVAVSAVQLTAN